MLYSDLRVKCSVVILSSLFFFERKGGVPLFFFLFFLRNTDTNVLPNGGNEAGWRDAEIFLLVRQKTEESRIRQSSDVCMYLR